MALSRADGRTASHQSGGSGSVFGRQGARPGGERLAQLVEGGHGRAAIGRLAICLELAHHRGRERLVEAHVQRPPSLPGKAAGLLDRDQALAAARRADDLEAARGPVLVEHDPLGARGAEQAIAVVVDVPPEQAVQAHDRGEELIDASELGVGQWMVAGPIAHPQGPGPLEGTSGGVVVGEVRGVEDQLAGGVGAEQDVAGREGREVRVGEGDGVARARAMVGWQGEHLADRVGEVSLRRLGLLERAARQGVVADEPAAGAVPTRLAGLGLDHQQAVLGMDDDEVGFAVVRRLVGSRARDEADVRVARGHPRAARRGCVSRRAARPVPPGSSSASSDSPTRCRDATRVKGLRHRYDRPVGRRRVALIAGVGRRGAGGQP